MYVFGPPGWEHTGAGPHLRDRQASEIEVVAAGGYAEKPQDLSPLESLLAPLPDVADVVRQALTSRASAQSHRLK
jgi:hypothetical protein